MIRCPLALLPLCLPLLLVAPELVVRPPALELLGSATLGSGTTFEGTTVGGLSALVYDPRRDRFLALSDGPGHGGPARFYSLEIGIADGILEPGEVRVTGVTEIRPESGKPAFTKSNFDPEGLAPSHHGTLYVSSEGNAEDGIPPLVAEMTSDGRLLHRFPLPPAFRPSARPARGVRLNLAFEPLTVTPSGERLITGTENALVQDGPKASLTRGSPSRLLVYDTRSRRVVRQHLYWTEPVAEPPLIPGTFKLNGMVEGKPEANMSLEELVQKTHNKTGEQGVFNNAAQAWNHAFFWKCMRPAGGDHPGERGRPVERVGEVPAGHAPQHLVDPPVAIEVPKPRAPRDQRRSRRRRRPNLRAPIPRRLAPGLEQCLAPPLLPGLRDGASLLIDEVPEGNVGSTGGRQLDEFHSRMAFSEVQRDARCSSPQLVTQIAIVLLDHRNDHPELPDELHRDFQCNEHGPCSPLDAFVRARPSTRPVTSRAPEHPGRRGSLALARRVCGRGQEGRRIEHRDDLGRVGRQRT